MTNGWRMWSDSRSDDSQTGQPQIVRRGFLWVAAVALLLAIAAETVNGTVRYPALPLMLLGPAGTVLGIVALVQSARRGQYGRWIAWSAVIWGLWTSWVALIVKPLDDDRTIPREVACLENLRSLGQAADLYCQDYNDSFPQTVNWNSSLAHYLDRINNDPRNGGPTPSRYRLICQRVGGNVPCYAMNSSLASVTKSKVASPDWTPLFFDSIPGHNQAGGKSLLPNPPRHPYDSNMITRVDGSTGSVRPEDVRRLHWQPKQSKPSP